MSKETARNLFMFSSMPALYQQLLSGISNYEWLAVRILQQIKAAHAFRQVEQVRELATILGNIPIKEYQLIGQYYLIWCNYRESVFKAEALENLIGQTRTYKTNVLLSRAAIEVCQGKMETGLYFYNEALHTAPVISDYIYIKLGVAQVKGFEGFHQSALNDIENLLPIIRYTEPKKFFETLNSYATELGEAGRRDEARNVMRVVLSSPFIHAYPEWQQTAADLQGGSRSLVQVAGLRVSPDNVLSLPHGPERVIQSAPLRPGERTGKLLDYVRLKKKMVKKKKKQSKLDENIDTMDRKDLVVKLLELVTPEEVDEVKMREIVRHAAEVINKS